VKPKTIQKCTYPFVFYVGSRHDSLLATLVNYYSLCDTQTAEYLSLAKRDRVELLSFKSLVLGKFQQRHGGVSAVGEYEDERSERTGVGE